jgi:cytochrome P450 family 4
MSQFKHTLMMIKLIHRSFISRITEISFMKMFDIVKQVEFLYRFTEMHKQERKCLKTLHAFTDSVIAAKRKELMNKIDDEAESANSKNDFGIRKKTALLDLLLQSTIDGKPLSDRDIREEVDTFMFAVKAY